MHATPHRPLERRPVLRPPCLRFGDVVGIATPSWPANLILREKYLYGVRALENLGFRVREGEITARGTTQGYRTAGPRDRARELMDLFLDPEVRAIVCTIGGANSASLLPYLDFDAIRANPKVFCGYSDVTSLHLGMLAHAGLATFYGPAVTPSFGEYPTVLADTRDSFFAATMDATPGERELIAPRRFSRHLLRVATGEWRTVPRRFEDNPGPRVLRPGTVTAPAIVVNLNTLLTSAGTSYFPDLEGRVLIIEEMNATMSNQERNLRHLERLGVFERVSAVVIGKPEVFDQEGAPFGYDELAQEIIPNREGVPLIMDFDCGHTSPMFTIAEETLLRVEATEGATPRVFACERMVVPRTEPGVEAQRRSHEQVP